MKNKFFFDIDGTLLPFGKKNVLGSTRYAIKQLVKNGNEVYIATGKSHKDAKWVGELIGIDNFLSANGQVVINEGEIIFEEYFDENLLLDIQKIALENNFTFGFQGNEESVVIKGDKFEEIVDFFKDVNIDLPPIVDQFRNEFKVTQLWIIGQGFEDIFPKEVRVVNWAYAGADIVLTQASKGRTISKLFSKECKTFGFGDGHNDIEMFNSVDVSVAMDNAKDEVKKHASIVAGDQYEHGIYNFLVKEKLIEPKTALKFAFLDIDGTLLPSGCSEIRPEIVEAVEKLKNNGVVPFIATGRNVSEAKKYIEQLNLDSYITSNGQEVCFKGEVIFQKYLSQKVIDDIISIANSCDTAWAYETRDLIYLPDKKYNRLVHEQIKGQGLINVEISDEKINDGVFQMWLFDEPEKISKAYELLKDKYNCVKWHETAIEILEKGYNKAVGIEILLNKFAEENINTYAFGDGNNDIEMMQYVDVAVAMGNATKEVKNVSDVVIGDCEDNALIKGFEELGLYGG